MTASESTKPLCLVRSSINIDQMFDVPHVVRPGETISSTSMQSRPGGKGANVSAAVALAGQRVVMSGAVGKDAAWPIDELATRGVDVSEIRTLDDAPTGRAFIQVAHNDGENSIVLLKGANFHPDPQHADDPRNVFRALKTPPTHLIVQNEIPLATTKAFIHFAHSRQPRCTTVFNPSPMLKDDEVRAFAWQDVDVLIINEGEGKDLLNAFGNGNGGEGQNDTTSDVLGALAALPALAHTSWLVMTKGARGVSAYVAGQRIDVDAARPKHVVDTTGAGDTFAGNLVAGLMRLHAAAADDGRAVDAQSARDVLRWAGAAAAVAVERSGAMESIPRLADVQKREKELLGT